MKVIGNQQSEIRSEKQEGLPFRSLARRRVAVGISGGVDSEGVFEMQTDPKTCWFLPFLFTKTVADRHTIW